jgi:uncharacterized protein (TIGR03437 family)
MAQTATATPASLSFTWQVGTALPVAQSVSVRVSAGTPAYTAAINPANALWLTVAPDTGKMPASFSIRVNPTSLAVGTYSASVVVTITGINTPLSIPVTLTVQPPQPTLNLSASTLNFATPPNPPTAQTILLTATSGPVPFTALGGATWMSVSPASGVALPGAPAVVTVTVDGSGLEPQTTAYSGKVTITATGVPAANKTQNVTVNLTVNAETPTVTSLWPNTARTNSGAMTVTIRGTKYYKTSVAKIQGTVAPLATTYLSPTVLLAVIPASSFTAAATLQVVVSNQAPGGDSLPSPFAVSNGPIVQAVMNTASYDPNAIAPGEIVTLFGTDIGPTTPVSMTSAAGSFTIGQVTTPANFVTTTNGGVTVTIDSVAAPVLYADQNQVTVQVPYTVNLGASKAVSVANGTTTATGTVVIASAAPGLFTLDQSGKGQAVCLIYNATTQQYTLNSTTNAAKIGDTVVLYLTGEGDYATSISPRSGLLFPTMNPMPQVSPLPTVTIGGAPATVNYAGPSPGSMIGVLQINAVIGGGATPSKTAPVVVSFGGVDTQSGVTINLKP